MTSKPEFYMVRNWDRFQHYSRRNPPWIKLYNSILTDYDFRSLSDRSKLILLLVWTLASLTKNKITSDTAQLRALLGLGGRSIDLTELLDNQYLIPYDASKALACCKRYPETHAIPESETESETETKTETETKKKPPKPPGVCVTSFNLFWSAYPKKRKKADARKAWEKLKPWQTGDQVNMILRAIEKQKRSKQWTKEDGDFIPLPASWLRGECWLDEIEVEIPDDGIPRGSPQNMAVLRRAIQRAEESK